MTKRNVAGICVINECDSRTVGRGWCQKHYMRWVRMGDPLTTRTESKGSIEFRFWKQVKVAGVDECWEWQGGNGSGGYGATGLFLGRSIGTHKAAFFLSNGYWAKLYVLHSCDNPPCCNPKHLREGSNQDNANDASERSRWAVGERAGSSKLKEHQVREILAEIKKGCSQAALGRKWNVNQTTIGQIARRKAWRHINL